jgi:hypothetical protein
VQDAGHRFDICWTVQQQCYAAGGIAAGFYFTAVRIKYAHFDIGFGGRFEENQLIKTDSGLAISDGMRARSGHFYCHRPPVNHDKIIAEPVHFMKSSARHGPTLAQSGPRCDVSFIGPVFLGPILSDLPEFFLDARRQHNRFRLNMLRPVGGQKILLRKDCAGVGD